jgi:hypothetical protein
VLSRNCSAPFRSGSDADSNADVCDEVANQDATDRNIPFGGAGVRGAELSGERPNISTSHERDLVIAPEAAKSRAWRFRSCHYSGAARGCPTIACR